MATKQQIAPLKRRASLVETDLDDFTPQRMPSSSLRRDRTVIVNGKKYIFHDTPPPQQQKTEALPKQRKRAHPLLFMGVGMFAMFCLYALGNSLVSWGNATMDDMHYGRPRTFQIDQVVGHNDSLLHPTHFLASNVNRKIVVFELPGSDISKARVYLISSLFGDGSELAPVTLSFRDVNGDGKPDMIITVAGSRIIYINDNGVFRPLKTGEEVIA